MTPVALRIIFNKVLFIYLHLLNGQYDFDVDDPVKENDPVFDGDEEAEVRASIPPNALTPFDVAHGGKGGQQGGCSNCGWTGLACVINFFVAYYNEMYFNYKLTSTISKTLTSSIENLTILYICRVAK